MERGGEMRSHFAFKLKRRAIIAVMGLPFTFRMEMANYIANWAKCPNLKLEVTLSKLPNVDEQGGAAGGAVMTTTNPSVSDIAFNILCETAVSLLENDRYHPNWVVINFPTPTIPQLQKLLSLHVYGCDYDDFVDDEEILFEVDDYHIRPHRLLIIECQRRNKFRWRQDVEHPDQGTTLNRMYRTGNREPGKWEDVEKAILNHQQEGLDDYLITLAADQCCTDVDVKKLVVDPFQDLRARDFTKTQGLDRRSLFGEAIKYYLNCDDDEYEDLGVSLDYALWRRQWLEHQVSSSRRGTSTTVEHHWCEPGECILRFTENLEAAGVVCEACENEVAEGEGAYYCLFCSLCLHELCALAQCPVTAMAATKSMIPLPQVLEAYSSWHEDIFNKTHACYSCEKDGKRFSEDCDACVFRTHLKCQLLPTALKHSCDQHHFLSIRLSWRSKMKTLYDCKACGLRGVISSYCCNICNSEYHLPCVLDMPLHTKEVAHGGHTHSININFSCGQREHEYEWCGVCYDDINPDTWVYTCQDCDFVAHLYCIFPSQLFELYKKLTLYDWLEWSND